jgi:broad specificity phosphatase PhoE
MRLQPVPAADFVPGLARRWFIALALLTGNLWLSPVLAAAGAEEAALLAALQRPGHVLLMRHADAPGTGDPANMRLGDCSTQRNLSADGRRQAASAGELLRAAGIRQAEVHSSQWCRCMDTASLLGLGKPQALPLLNSFFSRAGEGKAQTKALQAWLAGHKGRLPLVLVTHQVNITELTGIYPDTGELIILQLSESDTVRVLGRIRTRAGF